MENYTKRVTAYCPKIENMVCQEFSCTIRNNKLDVLTTCTGIRASCNECFIVKMYNEK